MFTSVLNVEETENCDVLIIHLTSICARWIAQTASVISVQALTTVIQVNCVSLTPCIWIPCCFL